jgi:MoaA/NifB/PqqE/SkfB family radical SAM enzyme
MCDIWKTTATEDFSLEQLQAMLPDLDRLQTRWVVFSGGEPLMHADLFPLVRTLRRRSIQVTILSTGLLLERHAADIAETVDEVIVSLDGPEEIHDRIRRTPGCFRAIERGIQAIRSQSPDFVIRARSTVQQANHAQIAETVAAARTLSLTSLSFLAADVTSQAFGREQIWNFERQSTVQLNATQIATLDTQIERLIEALIENGDGFIADTPRHLRRIVRHFRAQLGLEPFEAPRCNAPWVSAVLEPNGDLRPCFFHPIVATADAGIEAALNKPASLAFRSELDVAANPTCQRCVCSLYLPA